MSGALQLDLYLEDIALAIEYNGEYWHDRKAYEDDLANGTTFSRERLKDSLCASKNINLIHVWSSDWIVEPEGTLDSISNLILDRIAEIKETN